MTELQIFALAAVLAAIVLDIVTGISKAVYTQTVSSQKMREGFFHKFAIIILMVVTIALNYAAVFLDLGFSVPLVECAAVYLVVMELASILENLRVINPELSSNGLFKILSSSVESQTKGD